MRTISIYPLIVAACLAMSACGQKGPLYLPQDPDTQATEAESIQPDEQDTQNKEEKAAE